MVSFLQKRYKCKWNSIKGEKYGSILTNSRMENRYGSKTGKRREMWVYFMAEAIITTVSEQF